MDYFLIFAIIVVGLIPVLYEISKGIFDFFNIKNLFLVYYIIVLAVSGYYSLTTGKVDKVIGLPVEANQIYYTRALIAALIGIVGFQLGYYATSNRGIKLPSFLNSNWKPLNLSFLYYSFIIIGLLAFSIFLLLNGGLMNFLENREAFRQRGVSGQGIMMYPSTQLMAFACFLFFFSKIILRYNNNTLTNKWMKYLLLIIVLSVCILPSFIFGFRSLIGISILQFLVLWNYGYKKIGTGRLIPIFLIIMLGFTIYGIVRGIPANRDINLKEIKEVLKKEPQLAYNAILRVRGTEIVASVIKRLSESKEYDLGYKAIFEAVTIPIPHLLWKNKPHTSTVRFTTYFFGEQIAKSRNEKKGTLYGGISPTVVGELYWHFSWFGVIFILFILGVLYKKIYYTFLKNKKNFNILFIYAILFPSFVLFAETLQGYVNGIIISIVPVLVIIIILKVKISR
jgi:hypothetical protein